MKRHLNVWISGKVQGVWYRVSTMDKAQALGVKGFVRNESDGKVYAELEGTPEALEAMVAWCKQGSPLAKVEEVYTEEGEIENFTRFHIQR